MIDIHTHPVQVEELVQDDSDLTRAIRDVFGLYVKPQPLATFLYQLDEAGIDQAVLLPLDCTAAHGCRIVSNEQIVHLVETSSRFIGFASVDPHDPAAPRTLEKAIREYGLRGLKLDPALQDFDIGDRERAYPVYQACCELDVPIVMHCGLSWAPKGRAARAHPLLLEEVIHSFPNLRVVIAHFGWPWVAEAVMLALKHRNVYLDTSILYSGTPPQALAQVLGQQVGLHVVESSLSGQVVFGSNYPRVDPKRVAQGVRNLGLRPQIERRVMHDNAVQLLKLGGAGA